MVNVRVSLPKPEIRGVGHVWYRCATCGELMEPADAVIVADRSYHPDHAPSGDVAPRATVANSGDGGLRYAEASG